MPKPNLFVTGGSRGIGASLTQLAAEQGYRVILSYNKNAESAKSIVEHVQDSGGEAECVQLDITQYDAVINFFEKFEGRFGQLNALVNNAGAVAPASRFEELSVERLQQTFAANYFGTAYCCQEAVKLMSTRYGKAGGVIINVSSIAASLGSPFEYVDYASAKAAVDTLSIGLAKEVADEGIRVVSVRPGLIDTDLHADSGDRERPYKLSHLVPMKRPGTPSEVAHTILYLLSERASYITGTLIDVGGGR